jgi:hypothetical protein
MMRLSSKFTLLLALLIASIAQAATPGPSSADLLEAKKVIETMISSRFERDLETRLPKSEFTVSTRVELVRKPQAPIQLPAMPKLPEIQIEKPAQQETVDSFLPSATGLIDAERIMESYQNELRRSQSQAQQTQALAQWQASVQASLHRNGSDLSQMLETLSQYDVTQVSVSIGVQGTVGDEYRTTLEQWATNRVRFEFGKVGSSEVHFIQKAYEKPKSPFDILEPFETLISVALIGLLAFVCFVAWLLYVPRLQARTQIETAEIAARPEIPSQERTASDQSVQIERADAVTPVDQIYTEETVTVLMVKVSRIIDSLQTAERKDVVRLLTQKSRDGHIKATYAIEAWFASHEANRVEDNLFAWLNELDLPLRRKMELIAQWRELPAISLRDKGRFLNELFWDLIAYKTLGSFAVEKPFEFLSDLTADEVKSIIEKKDRRTQSLVFLFLPEKTQKSLLTRVGKSEQQELLKSCFTTPIIEVDALNLAHADLKLDVSRSLDRKISVVDRLGELLAQMDVLDEISLLRQTISQFGTEGALFKQRYPSLAFIDEWTDRSALRTLASEASTDELVSLVSEFPQIEERILAACAPMIEQIVRDEISRESRKQRADRRSELASLTTKLKALVTAGKLPYENLFTQESGNVIPFAA